MILKEIVFILTMAITVLYTYIYSSGKLIYLWIH